MALVAGFEGAAGRHQGRRRDFGFLLDAALYITSVLPGSTAWAGDPAAIPMIAGHVFLPNLAVAAGFLVLTVLGWRMARPVTV